VQEIERAVFADPWPMDDFEDCIASDAVFLVALAPGPKGGGGVVAGYVVARAIADEGEILNLAVAPDGRRGGTGRALVTAALRVLAERGVRDVFLEVRESNAGARALYGAHGFREVGRRPRYYRRPAEDAIILRAAIVAVGGNA
jgi:ribosomal-protein-alanine N-acetyltransferase